MVTLTIAQCLLIPFPREPFAQGEIGIHTTGLYEANTPMLLRSDTHWQTNMNFTSYFLTLPGKAIDSLKNKHNQSRLGLSMVYDWRGGITVFEAINCFENERCTIIVKWNGQLWTSKTSKEWIKRPSFQISHQEETNYTYTSHTKIELTHTFNGPMTKRIYFNQLKILIRASQMQFVYIRKIPIYFWLNCSHLSPMYGVFGISSDQLLHV
ncbi:hypothetical protein DSO57_1017516 [Entomophthora muscae]|uniref:Uncharacterized protein n=1 Tax=Entomophthora muscae TaxID=34485 RepID=A0ACC2T5F0_9FUNG|nr:hypothetical protein DSO57_1017516 [Entomophthora muscae]